MLGVTEHVVEAGSDVRLPCQLEGSQDQVVVWRLAGPGHQDRILSVGKMLVRNDGKGKELLRQCLMSHYKVIGCHRYVEVIKSDLVNYNYYKTRSLKYMYCM